MKSKEYGIALNWNYVIVSVVVVAVFTLMVLYMPNLRTIDTNILNAVRHALLPFPSYIPVVVSEFGRANYMLWPQIAACCTLVSHKYYMKAFLLVLFTQLTFFLNGLLKEFVCRERPCGNAYTGFSFPSCHASTTMCFYGIIIYLILHYVKNDFWRNFLAVLIGLFIMLVAMSRLWLGVHFLSDVIAGLFLGFMLVNLYIIISKSFSN